MHVVTDDTR